MMVEVEEEDAGQVFGVGISMDNNLENSTQVKVKIPPTFDLTDFA